ncbi:hypothetical protein FA15DRAFT_656578 [Coprinopsis marcescibilis]|uniref:Uncharacterized protein n=1 Tax=Coprinopsis marcescibilis TaxID=230819 RepID=A0A5C3KT48_COPMA|nr:hypothetical protein FA15DRAFT_656578 [Coprinopsis marcescibilis]
MSDWDAGSALSIAFATAGVEGFLSGILLVLFTLALHLLISRAPDLVPRHSRLSCKFPRPVVWGSILLLLIISGHWTCTMARVVEMGRAIGKGSSIVDYLSWTADELAIAKLSFLMLACLVSDGLMMWRLWIVSSRNRYVLAPPVLSWLASLGAMMRVCAYYVQSRANPSLELSEVADAIPAVGYSTILIAFNNNNRDKFKSLLTIIVEGAVVWAAWTLFVVVAYYTNSPLMPLAFDGCPAVAGIAFMLINVRVGLGRDTSLSTIARRSSDIIPSFDRTVQSDSVQLADLRMSEIDAPLRIWVK